MPGKYARRIAPPHISQYAPASPRQAPDKTPTSPPAGVPIATRKSKFNIFGGNYALSSR